MKNPHATTGEGGLSIIAPGMRVEGEIVTSGVVKVEGTVVGTINAEQQVLVAGGGRVEGDLRTREAIIGGLVQGGVFAQERVEIQPAAAVHGDITTFRLLIHEGGEVNGLIRMGPPESFGASDTGGSDKHASASVR
ncbi:MAG TPA: polymer-forming cytoskeletal protein [Gemmatimonadales bacterium]|nr:polymer-forming cytoskeletal protein [Gemmatimonadales bacterium]